MPELIRDPPNRLSCVKCQRGPRVTRTVQLEWPYPTLLRAPPNSIPDAIHVAFIERSTGLGTEHRCRNLLPAATDTLDTSSSEKIEERRCEPDGVLPRGFRLEVGDGLGREQARASQTRGSMYVGSPILRQGQHRHHRCRGRIDRDRDLMPFAIIGSR